MPKAQEALFSHFFIWSLQQPSATYRVSFRESHREGGKKPSEAYNSLKAKYKLKAINLDLFMILTLVYQVWCQ